MNVIDEFWSRFVNTNPQYKDKKYIEAFYFSLSEKSAKLFAILTPPSTPL